mmetsp:Transcript_52715/g.133858  ORF Transcript_52715/g.133858 Transcript_52715/m.133858 type:complete len:210 (+) Transcript_52715:49-678(+)
MWGCSVADTSALLDTVEEPCSEAPRKGVGVVLEHLQELHVVEIHILSVDFAIPIDIHHRHQIPLDVLPVHLHVPEVRERLLHTEDAAHEESGSLAGLLHRVARAEAERGAHGKASAEWAQVRRREHSHAARHARHFEAGVLRLRRLVLASQLLEEPGHTACRGGGAGQRAAPEQLPGGARGKAQEHRGGAGGAGGCPGRRREKTVLCST